MTIERFMIDDAGELIDLNTHKFVDYGDEVCNLLNELNNENKELKKELGSFKPIIFESENGATTLYEKRGLD